MSQAECPNCGWSCDVPDGSDGCRATCPNCGMMFHVALEYSANRRHDADNVILDAELAEDQPGLWKRAADSVRVLLGRGVFKAECSGCKEPLKITREEVERGGYTCPACGQRNPIPPEVQQHYDRRRAEEEEKRKEKKRRREARQAQRGSRKEAEEQREKQQKLPALRQDPGPPPPALPSEASRTAGAKAGHTAQAPTVNVNLPKRASSFGIVGFVVGTVALLLSFVPFIGLASIPLAALALLMGAIGFVISLSRSGAGMGWPIGGGAFALLALFIGSCQVAIIGSCQEAMLAPGLQEGQVQSAQATRENERAEGAAYLPNVRLRNIKVEENILGQKGVLGEVKNAGDRTLNEVQIAVYCLNASGEPVYEDHFHPVLVVASPFSIEDNKPLKPGYARKFGYRLDEAPSEWSGQVRIEVTSIAFAEAAR